MLVFQNEKCNIVSLNAQELNVARQDIFSTLYHSNINLILYFFKRNNSMSFLSKLSNYVFALCKATST